MHFPFGIRPRREGTIMPTALPLVFLLGPVSGADTSSILQCVSRLAEVLNTGGGFSGYRRFALPAFEGVPVRDGALAGRNSDDEAIKACLSRAFRMIRWR